jgi:hypothetical protein
MKARLVAARLAACALPLCLVGALAWQGPALSSRQTKEAETFSVVLTGELNGHITPCGCSKPMLGGLPRRASYLRSLGEKSAVVRIENGDLTEALGRQDELKAETIIEALDLLRYDAVNLGEKDFRLGVPYLLSLQARFKGALLSANVCGMDGSPLFKESAIITREIAGRTLRIALVGLLSEQFAETVRSVNPDLQVKSPAEVFARLEPELAARSDVRLLLYHGPREEAEDLARRFPGVQLIAYTHAGDHPAEAQKVGTVALACGGQDGKYVTRIRFGAEKAERASDLRNVALTPDFADNTEIMQIKHSYLERVAAEDLLGKAPKVATPNGDTYAGTAACVSCHREAGQVWKASLHARAFQTLAEEKEEKDPDCVPCHVVGLERVSGFASHEKTPHLENVGCESCHGPAAKHVRDPQVKLAPAGTASCETCHVPQHSPNFDFATYWPKIKHGHDGAASK